jgi:hypothetical protein
MRELEGVAAAVWRVSPEGAARQGQGCAVLRPLGPSIPDLPGVRRALADQVRRFCEDLERDGRCEDWQVRQAENALRIYFSTSSTSRSDRLARYPAQRNSHRTSTRR